MHGRLRRNPQSRYPRPIGAPSYQSDGYYVATINETIDASVFKRWQVDPKYRPQGLVTWASQTGFDLNSCHGDVRADDPRLEIHLQGVPIVDQQVA
jgi:hypothetical protein